MPLARKAISFLSDSFVSIRITVFEAFLQRGWYRREIFCQQDILIQNQIFLDGFRPTQASLKGSKFLRLSGRNLRDSRYEHSDLTYDCTDGTIEVPGTRWRTEATGFVTNGVA